MVDRPFRRAPLLLRLVLGQETSAPLRTSSIAPTPTPTSVEEAPPVQSFPYVLAASTVIGAPTLQRIGINPTGPSNHTALPTHSQLTKMEITVRVEVQYNAPEHALVRDMLRMFRTPVWVRFMVRYISPHLKNCAPANKDVVESLNQWRVKRDCATSCVICMNDMTDAIELPCGHSFHQNCIESWLKMRSTCPTCRHQLPKAFSGCYAVRTLNSALLLKDEQRQMPKDDILNCPVGKEPVRAIVNVTLGQVSEENKQQQFPCVLNALMAFSNGELFSELDVDKIDSASTEQPAAVEPVEPVETFLTTPTSSPSSSAAVTGRRRHREDTSCATAASCMAPPTRAKRARVN